MKGLIYDDRVQQCKVTVIELNVIDFDLRSKIVMSRRNLL